METAIIRRFGFRVRRKLDTVRALMPIGRLQEEELWREMQIASAGEPLAAFPQIFRGIHLEENLRELRQDYPEPCSAIEQHSRAVLQHRFDLLGSGLVDLGDTLDWSLDFKSGKRWDHRDFRLQKLVELRDDSDVRVPWELSRCNHFVPLALAFMLTGDHSFAIEFENEVCSWREDNPYERSINWTCSMETAIRCFNWLVAYKVFSEKRKFATDFEQVFLLELYKGGRYIRTNLEDTGAGCNGNHYIANLLGLLYLGELFKNTANGREWREYALAELECEIALQTYEDGLDYESSLPYHGLVTEMFLFAHLLSLQSDFAFSERYVERLRQMLEQLSRFTQQDGTILPIGDADDSRLVRTFRRQPRDYRDLIAIGGVLFGTARPSGPMKAPETLLVFDLASLEKSEFSPTTLSEASFCFPASGFCRLRSDDLTVNFLAGPVGTAGLGNHKHNDILSFTLDYKGTPVLIDPGTYVYTADEQWRNAFRSAAGHNTVTVDGFEPNRFVGGLLFMLRNDSHPEITHWESHTEHDLVIAENDGYCRLDDPVIHRRSLFLHKTLQVLLVRDELIAQGVHHLDFNFQCDNIRVTLLQHDLVHLRPPGPAEGVLMASCDSRLKTGITTNWVSPSYGTKHAGLRLTGSSSGKLPFVALFAFLPAVGIDAESACQSIATARAAAGW